MLHTLYMIGNAALLLAVVFLAALCASLSASGACAKVTQMTGAVAVAALSVTHVTSCITAGSSALTTLRDFSKILLPSMCAAAAASGAATSAAAMPLRAMMRALTSSPSRAET